MSRFFVVLVAVMAVLSGGVQGVAARSVDSRFTLVVPTHVEAGRTFAIEFRVPARVAAVDGRMFLDTSVAEVVGLAPTGRGTGMEPVEIAGGYAFGAYGLTPRDGSTRMRVVLAPHKDAQLQFRLVIDSAADAAGNRVALSGGNVVSSLRVGGGTRLSAAPLSAAPMAPLRAAEPVSAPVADGTVDKKDLDVVRAGWAVARANDSACSSGLSADAASNTEANADANGDGCLDVADIQAIIWRQQADARGTSASAAAAVAGLTFVVNNATDTPDATNGDGICANAQGMCTLRAAITESNWQPGENRIEFNMPGTAPVPIQISATATLLIQDRTGGLVIDGYTQPGSAVNTATWGSNAVPGIELRGTGSSPAAYGLYLTSANNTIRGILFNNHYRSVFIDGVDAHDNRVVGNLIGYTAAGAAQAYVDAYASVEMNVGANHNFIGAPDLADRNVGGKVKKGLYMYGPGTDYNVVQNNLMCITPNGTALATCNVAIDHDFGPKNNLVGGTGPNERNVVGPTYLQGIEMSHGWDPSGVDTSDKWQVNSNRTIGNWVGFHMNGTYGPAFRSGQNNPGSSDNGNGINIYDGSNFNVVEGNWIASVYDGIQAMSPNATGNIIRGNVIGESPQGEPAPLGRDGIVVRLNTRSHLIEGNTIRNAGRYGIGLIQKDVLWIRLSRNIISDMSGPAIFLIADPGNPANGANNMQPAPVITSATTVDVVGTGTPGATVEVYRASRPAGQRGLPVAYLGATLVAADGTWSLPLLLQVGDLVTALQIAPSNNTSALSLNVATTFEQPDDPPAADFDWIQQAGSLEVNFTDTSTGSPAGWAWIFGDGTGSNAQNPSHTYAAPGDYQVTLAASNAGGSTNHVETITVAPLTVSNSVVDAFGRTVTNGWGTADIGGPYTVESTAANYSVANGLGKINLPAAGATRSARLNAVNERNVDIRFRIASNKIPAGGNLSVYAVCRRVGASEYRPRLIFSPNGSMSVNASVAVNGTESLVGPAVIVAGLNYVAGNFIWMRSECTGASPTTIRVKAWADGQPEPQAWQFTATHGEAALQGPGAVGVRGYLSSAVTNGPLAMSFDEFTVSATGSATTVAADSFLRTVSNGWGTANIGGLYTVQATAADYAVANGLGTINLPAAGATRSARLNDLNERNVDIHFRFAANTISSGGNLSVSAVCRRVGASEYRSRVIFMPNGSVSVNASVAVDGTENLLGPAVVVSGLSQTAGGFIWMRTECTGANPTTIRVKVWAAAQPEPQAWQFTATNGQAALQGLGAVGVRAYLSSSVTNAPVVLSFDDFAVTATQ
jgi:CSLREA domain-containing protein